MQEGGPISNRRLGGIYSVDWSLVLVVLVLSGPGILSTMAYQIGKASQDSDGKRLSPSWDLKPKTAMSAIVFVTAIPRDAR